MPETRLILHVKGTEHDTTELPKHAVREAISQGDLTYSQLIWVPEENTWKQVRELPDLLPAESVILHVKGTEAETRELPKQAVRTAISQGRMTMSQLIWSPNESTWKQVRELPDLLPGEPLILHIKGTEAGVAELPKQAIKAAVSQGRITHSQLIWSPAENTWKQLRQMPELLPTQKLAPAPPRTPVAVLPSIDVADSPTSPVARVAARASQAIPKVRVATEAPPRVRIASVAATPQIAKPQVATAQTPTGPATDGVPKVRVAAAATAGATPKVRVATAVPKVHVAADGAPPADGATPTAKPVAKSLVVKEKDDGFHPLKWLCLGLGLIIVIVVGANYLLVDQPLASAMGQTSYDKVPIYGHLGAFMQPNVLVIHFPNTSAVSQDKVLDFMMAVSRSTPQSPLGDQLFDRVALTTGWTAQYTFSGYSWKQLGDLQTETPEQQKEFLLDQLCDAGGQSLMPPSTLDEQLQQDKRDKIWATFAAKFSSGK